MRKMSIGCLLVILVFLAPLAAAKTTEDTSRVIVVFKDGMKAEDVDFIKKCGGKVKRHLKLVNGGVVEIPAKAIEKLKKNPRIKYVEPDLRIHAFQEIVPWGVDRIDADVVWTFGNKGMGVNVCVIDTGIDYTHPDLDDNYKGGYDFVNDDDDPLDDNGHGTHCAGIIAAENNTEGVIGVAPEVMVLSKTIYTKNNNQNHG
ncbi:S8 family peptidase [Archaeoglobus veneficus]|uniref:Peptidase S8 and S53 subtilisin kexin sedolisin n=1 Tax=Archaeoglobus veneficus (strain DSM 11195 / SNP6) TaxID=693661 RepID=F2KS08_ARCVS|nr:S8 family serine peptidase [Archaeoglobus veneficus]AEA46849.1 peptidase S8 and S53 subtilisin kexin sedolisin [Archaeoglobus veneficus SNP6]